VAFFCVSGAITGALVSLVPLLISYSYTPVRAAELAGVVGLAVIAGRLLVGLLVDRVWAPAVGAVFLVLPVLALVALANGDIGPIASMGAFILIGLAVGAEVDLNAFLTSRYFGMRSFGRLYSIQYMAIGAGAAAAAPLFGHVYDITNSYSMALYASAGLLLIFGPSLLVLGRYPEWSRAAPSTG
jgi:predicted MFS family arabinose efflux permease